VLSALFCSVLLRFLLLLLMYWCAVLCCAVLCCAVLCCAVLCCAVLVGSALFSSAPHCCTALLSFYALRTGQSRESLQPAEQRVSQQKSTAEVSVEEQSLTPEEQSRAEEQNQTAEHCRRVCCSVVFYPVPLCSFVPLCAMLQTECSQLSSAPFCSVLLFF
jgi:hypothetical protein